MKLFNKNTSRKFLLGLAVASAPFMLSIDKANAVDATGNATAVILSAITLTENTAMDFASIVPDPAGDTVTLTAANAISSTGSSTFSGTTSPGIFDATGNANAAVTISFSTGDTLTGPGTAMALSGLNHDAGGSPAFDGSGDLSFNVGAVLAVNAAQAAGTYTGTYTASVNYQ